MQTTTQDQQAKVEELSRSIRDLLPESTPLEVYGLLGRLEVAAEHAGWIDRYAAARENYGG